MFKQQLIIIRHGRSEYNIRQTKDLDSPLTDFGKRQAEAAGRLLKSHMALQTGAIYTSPFLRCLQTLEIINKHLPRHRLLLHQRQVVPDLREYVNHSGSEAIVENRREEYPEFDWSQCRNEEMVFKSEHNEDFMTRMMRLYMFLPQVSLAVTHGLPAMLLAKIATNPATNEIPIWDNSLDNGSITYIVNGRPIWYGRCGHPELDEDVPEEHL